LDLAGLADLLEACLPVEFLADVEVILAHRLAVGALDLVGAPFPFYAKMFEYLEADLRQRALKEIACVLKPGGVLALTFDYGAPAVFLASSGQSRGPQHLIQTPEDIQRHFLNCEELEPAGGAVFNDNGRRYPALPRDPGERYTFGAVFLQ
jgi:hypothetical protein